MATNKVKTTLTSRTKASKNMDAGLIPMIRLRVDGIKASVIHAMGAYDSDLGDAISGRIDEALRSVEIDEIIDDAVAESVNSAIRNFFRCGGGALAIEDAVSNALSDLVVTRKKDN